MARHILANGRVVTPSRILDAASLVIDDGRVVEVTTRPIAAEPGVLDLGGRLLMPGLVDLHDDALEKEVDPRPRAGFDVMLGLLTLDRRLAAAGVTTQYHGVSFNEQPEMGRTLAGAVAVCRAIERLRDSVTCVEHHILFRLELRTVGALEAVLAALAHEPAPIVSLDDHAPGRGKMADRAIHRDYVRRYLPATMSAAEVDAYIEQVVEQTRATEPLVTRTLHQLAEHQRAGQLVLASHDDDSAERVALLHRHGSRISEFPLAVAAAEQAAALGMQVAMGAPNVLRGGSLTGQVSARDLVRAGLVTMLVADYHPPSLLPAIFRLVDDGLVDLPAAVRMVSATPAAAAGLADRGSIAPGQRADLIAIDWVDGWPTVVGLWRAGQPRMATGSLLHSLAR